jgi:hypothetical protein
LQQQQQQLPALVLPLMPPAMLLLLLHARPLPAGPCPFPYHLCPVAAPLCHGPCLYHPAASLLLLLGQHSTAPQAHWHLRILPD